MVGQAGEYVIAFLADCADAAVFPELEFPALFIASGHPCHQCRVDAANGEVEVFGHFQPHLAVRGLLQGEICDDGGRLGGVGFLVVVTVTPHDDEECASSFCRVGNLHAHMSVVKTYAVHSHELPAKRIIGKVEG